MNTYVRTALSMICGIGVGLILWRIRYELKSPSGVNERQEFDSYNNNTESSPKTDMEKWGTREGIIEVAIDDSLKTDVSRESLYEKWGTPQGIIDVNFGDNQKPEELCEKELIIEKWSTPQGVMEVASCERQVRLAEAMNRHRKTTFLEEQKRRSRLRNKDSIQIAISNSSTEEREISLWGSSPFISPPKPTDIEDHQIINSVQVGSHPQGMIVNPANKLIYIANQLSNNVTVTTAQGEIIRTIPLTPSGYPGINSPTDLTVHTVVGKPAYGHVYVAGSVANTISVINASFEVIAIIPVGVRPVALTFNPKEELLYVANFASKSISVIDTQTNQVIENFPTTFNPTGLKVNTINQDIYVLFRFDNYIHVLNRQSTPDLVLVNSPNAFVQLEMPGQPACIEWNPVVRRMYVVIMSADKVAVIDADARMLIGEINVGLQPYGILLHQNGYLYVGNRADETITIIAADNSVRGTIPAIGVNIGFTVQDTTVLWTNPMRNRVEVMGYKSISSLVTTDLGALTSQANYFRVNPAQVQHLKIAVSGDLPVRNLYVREKTVTGKKKDTSISLTNYLSPQHFQRVYEVDTLRGSSLDGNTQWRFAIPPLQSISMLIYYDAFERDTLIDRKKISNQKIRSLWKRNQQSNVRP